MAHSPFSPLQIVQIVLSTYAILVGLRLFAPRLGLVDQPNFRKRHVGSIPLVGGIGLFLGGSLAAFSDSSPNVEVVWFFCLASAIVVIGVIDDRYDLPPLVKLTFQLLCVGCFLAFNPGQSFTLHELALPNSAVFLMNTVFITGAINAFNMLDGSDGLAGGVAAVVLASLTVTAHFSGASLSLFICATFLATVMAFLSMNLQTPWQPRATIFLGDAGSMLLGLIIAFSLLDLTRSAAQWRVSHAVFFLAFPIIEALSLFVRRIAAGRSPFSADRLHFHHLLADAGWTASATALGIATANGIMACVGAALHEVSAGLGISLTVFVAMLLAHALIVRRLQHSHRDTALYVSSVEK